MSFLILAPIVLSLSVFLALPIFAHLIRKMPQDRHYFGAMMLLRRLQKTQKRRRKIHDLLLLLLRILAMLAFILSFTQMIIQWPNVDQSTEVSSKVVLIVDNSMSMNHQLEDSTALDEAKQRAIEKIQSFPDEVQVAVIQGGFPAEVLSTGFIKDKSSLLALVSEIPQKHSITNIDAALQKSRSLLEGKGGDVILYTDEFGKQSGVLDEISLLIAQKGNFALDIVRNDTAQNITITQAEYAEGIEGGTVQFDLERFSMQNTLEDSEYTVITKLPGNVEIPTFQTIEKNNKTSAFITVPRITDGGIAEIQIQEKHLVFDNSYFFHLPRIGASRVLVVDGAPGATTLASEVYFLERALAPFGGKEGMVPDVVGATSLDTLNPEEHRVIFLANVSDPGVFAHELIDFVREGGGLMISLGSNVSAERYNTALGDILPAKLKRPETLALSGEEGKRTAIPNLEHMLFQSFRRAGSLGFRDVTWKSIFSLENLDHKDKVLLSLENGYPLLIEHQVGKGHVLLFLGTIDHGWGNFPTQAVYLPLIQQIVTYLGGEATQSQQRYSGFVGDTIVVELPEVEEELMLKGPSGNIGFRKDKRKLNFVPEVPGAYELQSSGGVIWARIAVNNQIVESDISIISSLTEQIAEREPEQFMHKEELGPYWLKISVFALILQFIVSAILGLQNEETEEKNNSNTTQEKDRSVRELEQA